MTHQPQPTIKQSLEVLAGLKRRYTQNQEQLTFLNNYIMDLLHEAEFKRLNASEGYEMYRKLHKARIKRRQHKDDNEVTQKALEALNTADVCAALQEVQHKERNMQNRTYTNRAESTKIMQAFKEAAENEKEH